MGAYSPVKLRTGPQASCQRVVPFGRLTMSGGHSCGLLGQASLDSSVKHENNGKEGGTGMTEGAGNFGIDTGLSIPISCIYSIPLTANSEAIERR